MNVLHTLGEAAMPYVNQAQEIAMPYVNQAQEIAMPYVNQAQEVGSQWMGRVVDYLDGSNSSTFVAEGAIGAVIMLAGLKFCRVSSPTKQGLSNSRGILKTASDVERILPPQRSWAQVVGNVAGRCMRLVVGIGVTAVGFAVLSDAYFRMQNLKGEDLSFQTIPKMG